jgi:predicted patatin/cPLA2 family phospholipase
MTVSVFQLLRNRAIERSTRSQRNDGNHLALVIEGGGMRGVVAGGMVSALEERDLTQCFDSVHGSSAGACAGAYFVAGQARLGTRMFYEDINSRRFISRRRALVGLPIMDTDYVINSVMRGSKLLDANKILSSPGTLHITVTDVETGRACIYSDFRDADHLFRVLAATITMPVISGPAVKIDGRHLVDGGMVQQIAVESALSAGATHILVLMTRKEGELERVDQPLRRWIESSALSRLYSANLANLYRGRNSSINDMISRVLRRGPDEAVLFDYVVRSESSTDVGRLTIDTGILRAADEDAQACVRSYLDDEPSARTSAEKRRTGASSRNAT